MFKTMLKNDLESMKEYLLLYDKRFENILNAK